MSLPYNLPQVLVTLFLY
jgi:hypothetical protein